MLLACIAALPLIALGDSAVSATGQAAERRLQYESLAILENLPEHQVDALYPKPGEKSPVYKYNPAVVYKVGTKNYLEGIPRDSMYEKKTSYKCKAFCRLYYRRDQACDKHYSSCGGCDVCQYNGKGFVEKGQQCPAWCAKFGEGCTKMPACKGCSDCGWFDRVTNSAEKVQKKIMKTPTWAVDTLAKWECKPWCYASEAESPEHQLKRNMCKYEHCLACPACEVRRLALIENATTADVPSVFV